MNEQHAPPTPHPLVCAECGREPSEGENAADDWRTYYEGVGDGVTLCPDRARASSARSPRSRFDGVDDSLVATQAAGWYAATQRRTSVSRLRA